MALDPMPTLPDEADPSTWVARWRALLEWMAGLGDAINQVSPFIDAYSAIVAQTNFIGNWDDQTGAATVPTSVYHDGLFWSLREDVADIAANEPSSASTKWAAFPASVRVLSQRAPTGAYSAFDFALPDGYAKFEISIDGMEHDGAANRALSIAFSTDAGATFGTPVEVGPQVAAAVSVDADLVFYRSTDVAKSLTSSALGDLGNIVPADCDAVRICVSTTGMILDRLAPAGAAGSLILTGIRGL